MARKTLDYVVSDDNRDKGKVFHITEMAASKAESWAARIILALFGTNPEVRESDLEELGMGKLAELGFKALGGLKWEVLEPLLAEMFECIQMVPDVKKPFIKRPLVEEDIEEVSTRLKLRFEIWQLHMGFLNAAAPSIFKKFAAATKKK